MGIITTEMFKNTAFKFLNENVVCFNDIKRDKDDLELISAQMLCDVYEINEIRDVFKLYDNFYEYFPDAFFIKINKENLNFQSPEEFPQSALLTATFGRGDCEDIARLQYFIHKHLKLRPFILIVFYENRGTIYGHAVNIAYNKDFDKTIVYVQDFGKIYKKVIIRDADEEMIFQTAIGMYRSVKNLIYAAVIDVSDWKPFVDNPCSNRLVIYRAYEQEELPIPIKADDIYVHFSLDKFFFYTGIGIIVLTIILRLI